MIIDGRKIDDTDLELIESARVVADSHSDGLIHTVGAAIRDSDGRVHTGINLFHFTGGPCAELVALATARANGARTLTTIVAVGDNGRGPMAPCGRDRQVLSDYHPGIRVLLPTPAGIRSVAIEELIPLSYGWDPAS